MSLNEVILMTATVNVKNTPDVTIKNEYERLLQYLCSLLAWINLDSVNTIVLCENSNTSYDFTKIVEFAKNKGKTLEVLVFDGNQESQQYGKGYGEGKIIKHAVNNSKYLNDEVNFYKITGRLFVPEFDKIQYLHAETHNIFKIPAFSPDNDPWAGIDQGDTKTIIGRSRSALRFIYVFLTRGRGRGPHNYNHHVSTVFYKSNVKFYKKHLINSYKRVNDRKSYAIEHIFYEDLIKKDFSKFLMSFHIVGKGGSTGKLIDGQDYTNDIQELAKTFI